MASIDRAQAPPPPGPPPPPSSSPTPASPAGPAASAPVPHEPLDAVELQALRQRREQAFARSSQADPQSLPRVGLALSGGGVRSATFAIGLIRGLAKGGLLNRIDFLSTVSGGGYAGALFGRLVDRVGLEHAQKALADDRSKVLDWVRRNGRYLTPAGSRDFGVAAVTYLRALLAIHTEAMFACLLLGLLVIAPHLWFYSTQTLAVDQWQDWVTPWWAWAALLWVGVAPGLIGAYWTARESQPLSWRDLALAGAFAAGAAAMAGLGRPRLFAEAGSAAPDVLSLGVVAAASLATGMVALWFWLRASREPHGHAVALARNRLTMDLKRLMVASIGLFGLGLLDRASWWILELFYSNQGDLLWGGLGLGGAVVLLLRVLAQPLQQLATEAGTRVRQWLPRLVNAAGWLALGTLVMLWLVALQWLVFAPDAFDIDVPPWLRAAGVALAWVLWVGLTAGNHHMANGSSLHSFYRARLVRAYLAVGNPRRGLCQDPAAAPVEPLPPELANDVTRVVEGDDIDLADYRPHARGGPLHLVNTCLNQTRDSDTLLYNADRKGAPLAAGPHGLEVESAPGRVDRIALAAAPEVGTLGRWAAISGAAASPGAGSYTSRGLALLLYFLGVRLGHWVRAAGPAVPLRWLSEFGWRRMPKVLMLTSEATAMFFGRDRPWWYLSDGGHFENTGVYPLLRRELDFILLSDASCDPRFEFADLENLVRKARIDLGCEIDFYSQESIDQSLGELRGTLSVLPPEVIGDQFSRRGVMLARIRYPSHGSGPRRQGTLLVVKPSLHQALDVDLIGYARANPEFPHESTGDQSFDEAQWESYHRLGCDFGRALSNTWLSDVPGWLRSAQHRDGLASARLAARRGAKAAGDAAAAASAAAAVPLWRRSTRAAIGTTIGLGASGTLLLSLWQLQDQVQRNMQDTQKQARELYTQVSTSLSDFNGACPQMPQHAVDQAQRLFSIEPEALPRPERAGVQRLRDRLLAQCERALDPREECVQAWNRIGRDLCGQVDDVATGANLALAYWSPRSLPVEQRNAAVALLGQLPLAGALWREPSADLALAEAQQAARDAAIAARREGGGGAAGEAPATAAVVAAPAPQAAVLEPPTRVEGPGAAGAEPAPDPQNGATAASGTGGGTRGIVVAGAGVAGSGAGQGAPALPAPPSATIQAGERATPPQADPLATQLRYACSAFEFSGGGTPTLYIQIYDEATRAAAERLRDELRNAAPYFLRIVSIENVNRTAEIEGQRHPVPWPQATLVVFDARDRACAESVANYVTPPDFDTGARGRAWVRDAPPSMKGRSGTLELWLPPQRDVGVRRAS